MNTRQVRAGDTAVSGPGVHFAVHFPVQFIYLAHYV
jgi:hypothetical protein